jgi:radical SAM protein with 4Fe4S-binding SPASM domain
VAPNGINGGKGFVFVSHRGEVYPSVFLPISGGDIKKQSLGDIYRNSPLFRDLRDAAKLGGKCGRCEFREICGGCRARAYAVTAFTSPSGSRSRSKRWQPSGTNAAIRELCRFVLRLGWALFSPCIRLLAAHPCAILHA